MHLNIIARILGLLLMIFSLTMLPPILVAVLYGETTSSTFAIAFGITLAVGLVFWLPSKQVNADMRTRDGFLITVCFWLVLSTFGALPLMLTEALNLSFINALFESVSGLTTTGATVISGLDDLPKSILYYRQQLQWLGGIGIVVIAVAILPMLGVGGMQLYRTETPGPMKDSKLTPRIRETANVLFKIYLALTAVCALAYWLAGMSGFDAISHSFSTVSIGGFSTHDASIGFFDSSAIMAICAFFMVISGINFALHFHVWHDRKISHYWSDPEARMYIYLLIGGVAITCLYLYYSGTYGWSESIRQGGFHLISIMTTTGFTTDNFSAWPTFLPFFLVFLSFFGACAGSTGGGIKIGRMLILGQQCIREIYRLVHPNALLPIKIQNRRIPSRVADAIWAFFGAYLAIFYLMVLLLLASGLDYVTAWSATAASLNNLGPGLGEVAINFADLNGFAKWVLCWGMLLGRLEIFTLLVLFTPTFWKN
ncbi:TrkH family potassium uptake protein [Porticoccaceae bacterium]|nr:TrkH family potassium uptake protein [Porticoccaceae bacterium]MDB9706267.1 TrkH family potassium uptake protein [Porticoccaceae bacterium]MDB9736746.1 TrkH family potassium uptake protein [Porticoccaceae bacterium]MDB9804537.1 TrkH family potassium uptake protein [Porticoccaceae bacterium]MDB9949724.1 TrkH family potassium uptake protein [Porticoccaceae bacterium]